MKFKQILLESVIENYKRDLEQYLGGSNGTYDFPYVPNATIVIEKNYMGDYGYALKVEARKNESVVATARVMQGGNVYYLDGNGSMVDETSKLPNPAGLFGRLLDIMK